MNYQIINHSTYHFRLKRGKNLLKRTRCIQTILKIPCWKMETVTMSKKWHPIYISLCRYPVAHFQPIKLALPQLCHISWTIKIVWKMWIIKSFFESHISYVFKCIIASILNRCSCVDAILTNATKTIKACRILWFLIHRLLICWEI